MVKRLSRRTFLGRSVAAAAAATTSVAAAARAAGVPKRQTAPALVAGLPDIVVVGAGTFGAWTALSLRERGARVTLLDAFGPGNPRATSCDETREIRASYGDREVYTRWAIRAMTLWKARQDEWNRKFMYRCGRLQLATHITPELEAEKVIFDRLSLKYEFLNHDEVQRRYPQVNFEGVGVAFYEPEAYVLTARDAIIAVGEALQRKGGTVRVAHVMPGRSAGRRMDNATLGGTDSLAAGMFVFACGPWLRTVFAKLLGNKLSTPRAESFYFGTPPGDTRFMCENLPVLTEPETGYYALPAVETGLKMAPSLRGSLQVDPDTQERIASPFMAKRARDLVAQRYPGLKDQPIVETRVCQMESSADGHFIIDRHPDFDNVWIAGGGSGHGFKHGPVIGEYLADRITGRATDPELAKTFGLVGRPDRPPVGRTMM